MDLPADHYYTITSDQNSFSALAANINKSSYHNLQVSRYFSASTVTWREEVERVRAACDSALPDSLDSIYFIDSGDASDWRDRYIETWGLAWDLTKRFEPHHELITGFDSQYENVQYISISRPWEYDPDGLGREHDLFHVYPNKGSLYAEDKLEYEGFIAKIGVRYDYWFPGEALERAIDDTTNTNITSFTRANFYHDTKEVFGHRFKAHMSPRLAISHPVTERDNLFFNYGHFTQWPTYYYIYSKITSVSSESYPRIGNPNLNPEIAVQYELGARHQFTNDMAGDVTLFYKDIYIPTAALHAAGGHRPVHGAAPADHVLFYRTWTTPGPGAWSWSSRRGGPTTFVRLSYTYSLATGIPTAPSWSRRPAATSARPTWARSMWWNRPMFTSWLEYWV
jgi:outer membrane receptor protein involved in Fe transport